MFSITGHLLTVGKRPVQVALPARFNNIAESPFRYKFRAFGLWLKAATGEPII